MVKNADTFQLADKSGFCRPKLLGLFLRTGLEIDFHGLTVSRNGNGLVLLSTQILLP